MKFFNDWKKNSPNTELSCTPCCPFESNNLTHPRVSVFPTNCRTNGETCCLNQLQINCRILSRPKKRKHLSVNDFPSSKKFRPNSSRKINEKNFEFQCSSNSSRSSFRTLRSDFNDNNRQDYDQSSFSSSSISFEQRDEFTSKILTSLSNNFVFFLFVKVNLFYFWRKRQLSAERNTMSEIFVELFDQWKTQSFENFDRSSHRSR